MAVRIPKPSAAVLAARQRAVVGAKAARFRIEWFIKNVSDKVQLTMKQRVTLAASILRDRVVQNISVPVTKGTGPLGGRVVTNRSKPGEFPRADTTQLMKTIFDDVRFSSGAWEGYVGTPLDYGLILETKMNRLLLVRTLAETRPVITKILTGPIK